MKRAFFRVLSTLAVSVLMLIVSASALHAQGQRASEPFLRVADVSTMEGHEGNTALWFTFELSYAPEHAVTLKYDTADDTAIHGQDYIGTFGTLTIAPGQTSASRSIYIIGDTDYEDDEMVVLYFDNVEGAYSQYSKATLTIQNDDPRPAETYITVDDPQVKEGFNYKYMTFTITRSGELNRTTPLQFSTADGTATANVDYSPWNNLHTSFNAGDTTLLVEVVIKGDREVEPDETLFLNLTTSASYTTLLKSQGVGTILNDDTGVLPTASISDAELIEGDSGSSVMTFTVTMTPEYDEMTQVRAAVVEQTALRIYDYREGEDDVVTFYPGETVKQFSVEILGDTVYEPDETFLVELHSPWKLTIADGQATGTILNDDPSFAITHFSLMDAATDTIVFEGLENGEINLDWIESSTKLTLQAQTSPASVGSVVFTLNGIAFRTDNAAPYTLTKDPNGNLKPWKHQLDTPYTLTATAYSEANGLGEMGGTKTITFTITEDPYFASVYEFSLIDAATDTVLIEEFEGGTVDLVALGGAKKLTIQAHVYGDEVGSVRFALNDNPKFRTDNTAPFTLGKNKGNNLKPWPYKFGVTYTLTAAPFSGKQASGERGFSNSITFTIVKSTPSGGDPTVTPTVPTLDGIPQDTRLLAVPPVP